MMTTSLVILFWACAALVAYSYVVYPPFVWCLSRLLGRERVAREIGVDDAPTVSLLIAAHNEETVMEQRLRNALALDYPPGRLEIVIASDGSSDGTVGIVERYAGQGVRLIEFTQRHGKAAALNRAIPQLQGEIVLLSDANTDLDPSSVRKLARWFHDPDVGVVCGRLVLTDPQGGRNADSLYWKYETLLKQCEARLGGLLGANGAIYAVRKSCYTPVPDDTLVDDFLIPLLARLRTGCSILYDAEAVAWEETAPDVREEFRRRARIGAGNFQNIGLLWPLLNPRRGFVALSFFSHKLLRWFCPFFFIGLFAGSLSLSNHQFYRFMFVMQTALYGIAVATLLAPRRLGLPKYMRLASMLVSMNAALLVGFFRWLGRAGQGAWSPTARREPSDRVCVENKSR